MKGIDGHLFKSGCDLLVVLPSFHALNIDLFASFLFRILLASVTKRPTEEPLYVKWLCMYVVNKQPLKLVRLQENDNLVQLYRHYNCIVN